MSLSDILTEEFEVLESIYPTELTKLSDTQIEIQIEPDDLPDGHDTFVTTLCVSYPPGYPDVLPQLSFQDLDDHISPEEQALLLQELTSAANDNLGLAMTFALVSVLKDKLSEVVKIRLARENQQEQEKERQAIEEEEERTRGTPVTVESFKIWKIKFDAEQKRLKAKANEDHLKGLSVKEREEFKKVNTRLSGRQLFLKNSDLDEDALEEDGVSVDVTLYERSGPDDDTREEEEGVVFSDSD